MVVTQGPWSKAYLVRMTKSEQVVEYTEAALILKHSKLFSGQETLFQKATERGVTEEALYIELWHACAGPLVALPREDLWRRFSLVEGQESLYS
ncbi:hypothetical protein MKW98_008422 [Papaver atlanticum]|uniref:Uncharacterized protein n=1 Tax=Papaver atlanticum TaxID=357466 RepID=A0AAD4XEP3_9MAGN|nr:hypothetical protein MKW98_008422 [Papaver atlanticum]